ARFERVADVHDDDQPAERLTPFQVALNQACPMALEIAAYTREPVSRQVDQMALLVKTEKYELSGAPGGAAGTRQRLAAAEPVDQARLAGVGAARDRDFAARVRG